jgi:hypothetical protein
MLETRNIYLFFIKICLLQLFISNIRWTQNIIYSKNSMIFTMLFSFLTLISSVLASTSQSIKYSIRIFYLPNAESKIPDVMRFAKHLAPETTHRSDSSPCQPLSCYSFGMNARCTLPLLLSSSRHFLNATIRPLRRQPLLWLWQFFNGSAECFAWIKELMFENDPYSAKPAFFVYFERSKRVRCS